MKNVIKLLTALSFAGFILTSCEGPMGPAGPNGKDGTDGTNGIDANATCTTCHNNSTLIETKQAQWAESVHATGENAAYANRSGCVQCHTSQGFLQAVATGSTSGLTIPTDPMQINCYTCHEIHTTFTSDDWALTKPGAETLILKYNGESLVYDNGNSNQCVGCHQARDVSPMPVIDGGDYTIANNRIGVHHAPMANFLLGKLPFELPGVAYPTTNPHFGDDGCITCHLATPYGYMAGGHQMGMTYSQHGGAEQLNTTGCLTCHSSVPDYETLQSTVSAKLAELQAQLTDAGIYDTSAELAVVGTFDSNIVMAYLNYDAVVQDKSMGVHNPGYINALLDNSITAMTDLGYPPPTK
jgi:nitrate/TMAO reductase-like tetraheme cytochrome c subunit